MREGAASGEDADGGLEAWEGEFRVSGVYDPQEAQYSAEPTGILHAPLAVTKATKRLRDRVREITDKRASGADVKQVIAKLNPVLRGWGNYFRTGTSSREFLKMDSFVYMRLLRWMYRRGGQRKTRRVRWTNQQFWEMGLYRLRGTVRYPAQAASVRSSLSRVRENRTHGLKGVC